MKDYMGLCLISGSVDMHVVNCRERRKYVILSHKNEMNSCINWNARPNSNQLITYYQPCQLLTKNRTIPCRILTINILTIFVCPDFQRSSARTGTWVPRDSPFNANSFNPPEQQPEVQTSSRGSPTLTTNALPLVRKFELLTE